MSVFYLDGARTLVLRQRFATSKYRSRRYEYAGAHAVRQLADEHVTTAYPKDNPAPAYRS